MAFSQISLPCTLTETINFLRRFLECVYTTSLSSKIKSVKRNYLYRCTSQIASHKFRLLRYITLLAHSIISFLSFLSFLFFFIYSFFLLSFLIAAFVFLYFIFAWLHLTIRLIFHRRCVELRMSLTFNIKFHSRINSTKTNYTNRRQICRRIPYNIFFTAIAP